MHISRITLAALAATALVGGQALAADIYEPPPAAAPPPAYTPVSAYDWSGFYLGLQGGYDWNNAASGGFTADVDGFIGGVYGGYNWQFAGPWVVGIDGSFNWSGASGSSAAAPIANSAEVDWKGFIRGRLGYAVDRFLIYGTAGAAVMDYNATAGAGSGSATPWGWTIGAGVEAAITQNVTARLDYAYQDYGTFSVTGSGAFAGAGVPVSVSSHTLMAGIALKY